jgi:AcrR family transcriptional regulator
MKTQTATRLSAPERRQRILDAAAQAFAARGYDAASVGEIASAAGITKPVLYDHFPSKQRLFVEVIEQARDELVGRGAVAMEADEPLERRIRAAVAEFFAWVEEHPEAARVLLVPPRGDPEVEAHSRRVQREATTALTQLLAAEPRLLAGARDRRRRLELFTEFMKSGMHGLAEWWAEHPGTPPAVLVDAVTDVVWTWVGARGGAASSAGASGAA